MTVNRQLLIGAACVAAGAAMLTFSAGVAAQQPAAAQTPAAPGAPAPGPGAAPVNPNAAATAADHKNMMEQLGIKALRPGPSGNESAPNHANYDESLANAYP